MKNRPVQTLDRKNINDIMNDITLSEHEIVTKILQLTPRQKPAEKEIRETVKKYNDMTCAVAMSEDIDWRESLVLELLNLYKGDK